MPIYEYVCSRCGHKLEALQKLSEAALTTCPACRAESLVKQVSAAGFQLKGSGWYATDFRSSGQKPAAGGDAAKPAETTADSAKTDGAKPPGDSPADTKSETKAASAAGGCGSSCACH
jgi:putative FmdB family regulatory protein